MTAHHPLPYWFARSLPPEELDLVIVGAGIVGLSTAYWASRQGRSVTVLEALHPGAGATGRSTGFLLTGSLVSPARLISRIGEEAALALWDLSRENAKLLHTEIFDRFADRCGFRREGSWRTALAGSDEERELEAGTELLARRGFPVDWKSAAAVRAETRGEGLGGALYVEGDGGLDPVALCQLLAERSGAEVRRGIQVRSVEAAGDRVRLRWNGGSLLARRVVLAANAYVAALLPELELGLRPLTLQALATEPVGRRLQGLWAVAPPSGLYVRQTAEGAFLAAGVGEPSRANAGGYLELPTARDQARLESEIGSLFPATEGLEVRHRWAGNVSLPDSGRPLVGPAPEIPGLAYACALGGHGLSLGFALGRRLGRWLGGDERALESRALDPGVDLARA